MSESFFSIQEDIRDVINVFREGTLSLFHHTSRCAARIPTQASHNLACATTYDGHPSLGKLLTPSLRNLFQANKKEILYVYDCGGCVGNVSE